MDEPDSERYPPIADHALIGDCHTAALVSHDGRLDWCCLPRFDSPSVFGALLDATRGGFFEIAPEGDVRGATRTYVDGTLVLESRYRTDTGEAVVTDFFAMRRGGRRHPRRELARIIHGIAGEVSFRVRIAPRFDYGRTAPWIRPHDRFVHTAVGGSNGLWIWSDAALTLTGRHDLTSTVTVRKGDRRHVAIRFRAPEDLGTMEPVDAADLESHLEETVSWWREFSSRGGLEGPNGPAVMRSALVLKAMTHAPTGAMIAAPTTSLPEVLSGERNWDYRFSWIRDSSFAVRALDALGITEEAKGFRTFLVRSAAGTAEEVQVLYGVGGERWIAETELDHLEGYLGSSPVRVGNGASHQRQLDILGELVDVGWEWHLRGHTPDADHWRFLQDVADSAAAGWNQPDRGLWEVRSSPAHFVHSKMMCWVALDRALRLAADIGDAGDRTAVWSRERAAIREALERDGYDGDRGVFRRAFGSDELDAALLLLPVFRFLDYDDPRMVRTTDAIRDELSEDGLLRRYRSDDGLDGDEGIFVACTFWLAECLARQSRWDEAQACFERAAATANDLGLFSEELDPASGKMLGNFPQALTHLSHIQAAVALTGRTLPS